ELVCLERQLLRRLAELGPSVSRQLEAQLGDLRLGGDRVLRHRGNDTLQRVEIVGQLIGRDRHPIIESRPWPFGLSKTTGDSLCRSFIRPAPAGRYEPAAASRPLPAASIVAPASAPPRLARLAARGSAL